jgi:hypothetical protein
VQARKEKAARIANRSCGGPKARRRAPTYEEWTRDELYDKAEDVGIERRSQMEKRELIDALRNHWLRADTVTV